MSYCDDNYALTDDERSAGIGSLLCGSYSQESEERDEERDKKYELRQLEYERHKKKITDELVLLMDKFDDNYTIRNQVINYFIKSNYLDMINNYSIKEKLPRDYINIANTNKCLEITLKTFFKNHANIPLSLEIITKIKLLIQELDNDSLNIVWDRVKKIQIFIHKEVDLILGSGASHDLPAEEMKNLLSLYRLHLNLKDIKSENIDNLCILIQEYNSISHHWKKIQILEYASNDFIPLLNSIIKLDMFQEVNKYKKAILEEFSLQE